MWLCRNVIAYATLQLKSNDTSRTASFKFLIAGFCNPLSLCYISLQTHRNILYIVYFFNKYHPRGAHKILYLFNVYVVCTLLPPTSESKPKLPELRTCKTSCAQVAGQRILGTYSTQMVLVIVNLQVCQQLVQIGS